MNIATLVEAFGTDQHLPFSAIAERIGRPNTTAVARRFCAAVKQQFGIRPRRRRFGGSVHWCYSRSQLELAAKQGRPLTKEQIEPSYSSYESLRDQLKIARGKIERLDTELAKAKAENAKRAARRANLKRMSGAELCDALDATCAQFERLAAELSQRTADAVPKPKPLAEYPEFF